MKPADPLRPQATPPQTLGPTKGRLTSSKIRDGHLERLAIVYVRQSSTQQVLDNRESTERQYALADYAQLLGWPKQRVVVIDDDQGHSGARADNHDFSVVVTISDASCWTKCPAPGIVTMVRSFATHFHVPESPSLFNAVSARPWNISTGAWTFGNSGGGARPGPDVAG